MNKKEFIEKYAKEHRYFSFSDVVSESGMSRPLTKKYLYELKETGIIFPAGRGVYSSISKTFPLEEKSRVVKIRQMISREYPNLDFIIWNTLSFQPYYHHQQTHNITFIELEYDAIHPIFDRISRDYRYVLIEKASRVPPKDFDITKDPIVIRLMLKNSPRQGHAATLEKMLVDLFIVKDKYFTMPNADYWELWRSLDSFYRVNVTDIIWYAKSRRYFGELYSQLIDNVGLKEVTFSAYLKTADKVTRKEGSNGKTNS